MIIKNRGKFHLLLTYLYRVFTRTGPHGKGCPCPKWGYYVGGCLFLNEILAVKYAPSARIGDSSPAEQLHISDAKEGKVGTRGITPELILDVKDRNE